MEKLQIAKILHEMMSIFKTGIHEEPYPLWHELDTNTIDLYLGAIELVQSYKYHNCSPARIHRYWQEWAKTHRVNHPSLLLDYKDLSKTEKQKDMFVVSLIRIMSFSEKSVE